MRLDQPVEFDSVDDQPVDLIFALFAPKEATGVEHLRALARVSRLLRQAELREQLRQARTADAIHALLVQDSGPARLSGLRAAHRKRPASATRPSPKLEWRRLVHRNRRQLVGEGRGDRGVAVGHHRQAFAVGAVHRIEGLFGAQLEALHLGERNARPGSPRRSPVAHRRGWARQGRQTLQSKE